ncbi:MAG: response regulator transcription factor [Actinomycetota bacterium]
MKVLLVDDHMLIRRGIANVVKESFDDSSIEEAENADAAIELLKEQSFDIALVDVRMPERDGLDLLKEIKADWPDLPVVMLSTYDHAAYAKRAISMGAAGYILKDATPSDLTQAISVALAGGGNVLSSRVIQNLFEDLSGAGAAGKVGPDDLTPREGEILELVAEGHSNKDIAAKLYLSEKTIKAHLASLYRKLDVHNRTQAAMLAVEWGVGKKPEEETPGGGVAFADRQEGTNS